jgi:hypothetical protein
MNGCKIVLIKTFLFVSSISVMLNGRYLFIIFFLTIYYIHHRVQEKYMLLQRSFVHTLPYFCYGYVKHSETCVHEMKTFHT